MINQQAMISFESIERRLRQVIGRPVDSRVMEWLPDSAEEGFLKGEQRVGSVLYAGIQDYTRLAEQTGPELLDSFINSCREQMIEVILACEGALDKFGGEEEVAFLGAAFPQPDHALRAVQAALEMQAASQRVLETWQRHLFEQVPIGIGIATGELIAGGVQPADFTVTGQTATLGRRLCGAAKGGEVLLCEETYTLVQHHMIVAPMSGLQFKGVEEDIIVYRVEELVSD